MAHSYQGSWKCITEARDGSIGSFGLVYIAAHMPDAGENGHDGKRFPGDLNKFWCDKKTADGFTYLDPARFHEVLRS